MLSLETKNPFDLTLLPVALLVAIAHTVTGMVIIIAGVNALLYTTPLSTISLVFEYDAPTISGALIFAGTLAIVPFFLPNMGKMLIVSLLMPQQVLLVMHLISIIMAIMLGHYPDGYVPKSGGWFISVDQIWLTSIVVWHTIEYGRMCLKAIRNSNE